MFIHSIVTRTILMGVLALVPFDVYALDTVLEHQKAIDYLNKKGEVYFRFWLDDRAMLTELTNQISLDNVVEQEVYAYANREEFLNFCTNYQYPYEVLTPSSDQIEPAMSDYAEGTWKQIDKYPTYQGFLDLLNQFQQKYPDLCKVMEIGMSGKQRKIMVLKLTKNVNQNQPKPAFYSTGNIHGDETEGIVLNLKMTQFLLENYGKDPRATSILDSSIVYFTPLHNPDGLYAGGDNTVKGATRVNASGQDLNRSYPDIVKGFPTKLQPEVKAVMDFEYKTNISLYIDFHGGVQMLLYPYSSIKKDVIDKSLFAYIMDAWKKEANKVKPGYISVVGPAMTTLYAANGTTKDWMTYFRHAKGCTMELYSTKTIPESAFEQYWGYNKVAYLNYLDQVRYGLRGLVTDARSGKGIGGAKIYLNNHDADSSWVYSNSEFGDFYRLVDQGTYSMTVTAPGYKSNSIEGLKVERNKATVVDVKLDPINTEITTTIQGKKGVSFLSTYKGFKGSWDIQRKNGMVAIYNVVGQQVYRCSIGSSTSVIVWNGTGMNGGVLGNGWYTAIFTLDKQHYTFKFVKSY